MGAKFVLVCARSRKRYTCAVVIAAKRAIIGFETPKRRTRSHGTPAIGG
jgi:hypothetical protein